MSGCGVNVRLDFVKGEILIHEVSDLQRRQSWPEMVKLNSKNNFKNTQARDGRTQYIYQPKPVEFT